MQDYDPATGRYIESDPVGLGGGINTYRYAYANPVEHLDPEGLSPDCNKIWCLPASIRKYTTSQEIGVTPWRLDNVSVDSPRPRNVGPLPDRDPIGNLWPAETAICFFARTRSYRDTTSRYREWSCLELCRGECGLQFKEVRYSEFIDQTERIRKEREQQVMQILAIWAWHRCKELLRDLR